MKKLSIKTSILIPTLVVLLAGIIAMVSIVAVLSSTSINDLTDDLMTAKVNEYTNKFESMFMDTYRVTTSLAPVVQQTAQRSANPREEVLDILGAALMANDTMLGFWTCWEPNAFDGQDSRHINAPYHDGTGRFVPYLFKDGAGFDVEALVDYDTATFYRGAMDSGIPFITDPYEYDVGGVTRLIYSVSIPMMKNNAVVGVMGADILLDHVVDTMNEGAILENGYLFTLSPSGLLASHKNRNLLLQHYSDIWLGAFSSEIQPILKNGGTFTSTAYSDQLSSNITFFVNSIMIGDTGNYWAICGEVPQGDVNEASTTLTILVIVTGAVLILLMGLTVLLIVRKQLEKLPVLTAAAEAMSIGDINSTIFDTGTADTHNEMVLLERAFAKMTDGIAEQARVLETVANGDFTATIRIRSEKDLMNKAIEALLDVNNSVIGDIRSSASQVAVGAAQISQASQNLAAGSNDQASTIERFSATLARIREMAEENAGISTLAQQQMQKVGSLVGECIGDMNQMLGAMQDINVSSQNISKVIKVIDDIAFQTNILALNAAVEAARAGQHGKGFAVVADEVRNLASKSAEAANETSELISKSIESVAEGNVIVKKVGESIQSVSEIAEQSAESVGKIYSASRHQNDSMVEVTAEITQLSTVVQENSSTAQQTASSSEEMSTQSTNLDNIVSRFKLKISKEPFTAVKAGPRHDKASYTPERSGFALSGTSDKY